MTHQAQREFVEAIAASAGEALPPFEELCRLADQLVGCRLFTAISWDVEAGTQCRLYSNRPDLFPARGPKTIRQSDWAAHVIYGREIYVANDPAALGRAFTTLDLILAAGCGAGLNIPIVVGGRTIGTVNLLHEENYYTPARVAAASGIVLPALACFLLQAGSKKEDQNG